MLLVTLGDLSLDIVISPTAPIATGSDVGGTVAFRIGGSAANVARAFVVLGGEATFVGAVGSDKLGRRLVRTLRATGVQAHVLYDHAPTARIAVVVLPNGERSFVTQRGASDSLTSSDMHRRWFKAASAVHLPGYSLLYEPLASAARLAADWAHQAAALVSVDLASAAPLRAFGADRARATVAAVRPDILFANTDEAAVFDGKLDDLAPIVVIKRGASGCDVNGLHVPTDPIDASDTTGAGDAFDAGFLFSMLTNRTGGDSALVRAARTGHAAAAMVLVTPRNGLTL